MTTEKYYRLHLSQITREQEDLLTEWCFAHGASGVAEALDFSQSLEDYSVSTQSQETFSCDVFFEQAPQVNLIDEIGSRWPNIVCKLTSENNQDWLAEWKKGFVPFPLVSGVWVVPHWCEAPKEAEAIIRMEPGMAFGTGTHETTQLAAHLLQEALKKRPHARVLDVGTGTGILAILAKLLGAREVIATDIDPEAVRVAQENFVLNTCEDIEVSTKELGEISGEFDVVVANIIDGVLIVLQNGLKKKVSDEGALVLSGIIDERLKHFTERFVLPPLKLLETGREGEWHAWLLERG